MNIAAWVVQAAAQLEDAGVTSARLDAELLACLALGYDRAYLIAHADKEVVPHDQKKAAELLARRLRREPLAYIRGSQEFYGRDFIVTSDTLIPRPESETIITLLKNLASKPGVLLDVGTGSGCLAVTAALELPQLTVLACDIDPRALMVARKNAARHKVQLHLFASNLLAASLEKKQTFDYLIANLPYVDPGWEVSAELSFEPAYALFAQQQGLALIDQLIEQIPRVLNKKGLVLLEADPRQHAQIIDHAKTVGLQHIATDGFIIVFQS